MIFRSTFLVGLYGLLSLANGDAAQAQVPLPPGTLEAILAPSSHSEYEWHFAESSEGTSNSCKMERRDLTRVSEGKVQTFRMLVSPDAGPPELRQQILVQLDRLEVDADGSKRAYHPGDPTGVGQCERIGSGPKTTFKGVCALDHIANGGVRLFVGPSPVPAYLVEKSTSPGKPGRTVRNAEFLNTWNCIWPRIANKEKIYVDLAAQLSPDQASKIPYRIFYANDVDVAAVFKPAIIPFDGHFPCIRAAKSDAPGYFVAATSDRKPDKVTRSSCDSSRYLDATSIPFIVVPQRLFPDVEIGDVAIGFAKTSSGDRLVFGVVGDLGPPQKLGEASIAFNEGLLNVSDPPMNAKDVDRRDIDLIEELRQGGITKIALLVLAKTASAFHDNYTPANIERVGRHVLARWNGAGNLSARLSRCIDSLPSNDPEHPQTPAPH